MPIFPVSAPRSPVPGASPRHLRILYADDLPELREVVRLSLSREGHGVEVAEDGGVAFQRVRADPSFDLVITDHHMPRTNGLELVSGLRRLGYPGKLLVVSSELSAEVAGAYQKLRVDRILFKPVYPALLQEVLGELFGGPLRPRP